MFGRLLKHQLKSTWKEFSILYLIIFGLCLLLGVSLKYSLTALLTITVCLLSGAILLILALYIIYVIRICGTSMFGKQGYLTFSIPVSNHSLILSKILTVIIYMLGFNIIINLSCFIVLSFLSPDNIASISNSFFNEFILLGERPALSIVQILINLLNTITAIVTLIFAFTLANCGIARNKRVFYAVLIFFGINILFSIITSFDPIKIYIGYDLTNFNLCIFDYYYINEFNSIISIWNLVWNIIKCIGLYCGAIYLLNNKIELE